MRTRIDFPTPGDAREELAQAGLDDARALIGAAVGRRIKASVAGREVRQVGGLFVKRVTGPFREIENELSILVHLRKAGVPVAEPVAFACQPPTAAMVTRALPAADTLERLILDQGTAEALAFARPLAHLVRGLHAAGVNHRDLYLGHVLVGTDRSLWLVDFGRAQQRRRVPRHRVVKDLAALDFSTPDRCASDATRMRFLVEYLGRGTSRHQLWTMARSIRRKSRRMRRHAERKVARGDANIHVNA